jgi:MraZ protein
MSGDFRGEFYQKVDAKARVSIPAAFRRALELEDPPSPEHTRPRVYLVYGGKYRNFVECYSKKGMDYETEIIMALDEDDEDREVLEIDMIQKSIVVELEPDGRIVLPPQVRQKIGLTAQDLAKGAEAFFAGRGDRFQMYRHDGAGQGGDEPAIKDDTVDMRNRRANAKKKVKAAP